MSTLWTPSGEHPVPRAPSGGANKGPSAAPKSPAGGPQAGAAASATTTGPGRGPSESARLAGADEHGPSEEEVKRSEEELKAVQEQLLRTPAEVVVANHAMGLWELAALHLSNRPPQLAQARLAIDALAALLDGLRGRLGEAEATLVEGLTQMRMAFVHFAQTTGAGRSEGAGTQAGG